jgi:hypothetical protein
MIKLISYIYIYGGVSSTTMTTSASATASATPESVTVHLERAPSASASGEEYWPLTLDAVRDCDLSYFNDDHSADMVRDGMRAIILTGELPEIKAKEINVWKYLSEYSPPSGRGFQFSSGDDNIVSLVQNNMLTGHSGYSMGWTMRNIEFIAKNGVAAHRDRFLENKRRS